MTPEQVRTPWPADYTEGTVPTPDQWRRHFLACTEAEQWVLAAQAIQGICDAHTCFVMDHAGRLELVRADIAEARADERRNTAEHIRARCDENEQWLRDEIITDDGFAQTIGLSVVKDMRGLAKQIAREAGGGQ